MDSTSDAFQIFSIPRRSWIMIEWMNAVPVSHGMSDAFSTGSQAQYPPQPSSEYDQRAPSRMPMPRASHAPRAKRRVERIHSASTRRVMSAPTANAKGTAKSVYPEYSIGGWIIMLGWRRSGLSPVPSSGATGEHLERRLHEDEQAAEERAEAEQHRRRPRRDLAHAPAREEEHEARPDRQHADPQQQRALLRGPRRGRSCRRAAWSSTSASRRPRRRSPTAGTRSRGPRTRRCVSPASA